MGLHINPLKKKKVLAVNPNRSVGNAETEEHMTLQEAALVAIVLTVAQIFTSFLSVLDWTQVAADPQSFVFNLVKFAGATFFSIFLVLSGMARYLAK